MTRSLRMAWIAGVLACALALAWSLGALAPGAAQASDEEAAAQVEAVEQGERAASDDAAAAPGDPEATEDGIAVSDEEGLATGELGDEDFGVAADEDAAVDEGTTTDEAASIDDSFAVGDEEGTDANNKAWGTPVGQDSTVGVGFIYLQAAELATGSTQQVAVVLDSDELALANARLTYADPSGTLHVVDASTLAAAAALFELTPADLGTYTLMSLSYSAYGTDGAPGLESFIDLTSIAEEPCTFAVVEALSAQSGDEDPSDMFYVLDANGEPQGFSSLSEALSVVASMQPSTQTVDGKFVVALDPGHGDYDPGASGNGLVEKDLTWKIALYCKEALEQYSDVVVVLTRDEDECPAIKERAQRAYDQGANVYVSIHINAAEVSYVYGAEVWYPTNTSYKSSTTYVPGSVLAQNVLDQLTALGLKDLGTKTRFIDDGRCYNDGTLADYYGLIRYPRMLGIAGIIVEHAFISNPGDAALLADESMLKAMGYADAQGIALTYGLGTKTVSLFGDTLAGMWYVDQGWITYVVEHGLMTGSKDADGIARNFFPEDSLTRGQVATILYRAANPGSTDTDDPADYALSNGFKDSPTDENGNPQAAYYNAAIRWCADKGIVTGYQGGANDGKFLPDQAVTREELATMVYRFAQAMGIDVSGADASAFLQTTDYNTVQAYAHDAMVWCAAQGIITGVNNAGVLSLEPQEGATRAQAAKVITVLFRDVLGN